MKLKFSHLTKRFGPQTVINNLDLTTPECKTLVITGPSGSGKSTLLRLIAGLEYPDEGTISIDDYTINYSEKDLLQHRRSLGVVFQSWNLFPHLTALENIVLPLQHVHGMSPTAATELSLDLLRRFQLEKHAHKKPFALSGGQKQRVALIRAIASNPKLLLLDEPTSALDPAMTNEVLELILELKNDNHNLILVTHHIPFAEKIADHILKF
ncbi:MAG: amino acid ABC transporter ATP-binding protein [Parachlamydiaceae bacterium]|nr:amino acid ABC transporter ATP-binding protein [Parachlamydiaceae bacterium]